MGWYGYDFPKYVTVAERKKKAEKEVAKLAQKGIKTNPIVATGRKFTQTFWGNAWCHHIETFRDYENRLPRGRSYLRNGSIIDLQIEKGKISSLVQGSSLYETEIKIKNLNKKKWDNIKKICTGKIGSLIELVQGKLSEEIIGALCDQNEGLFPTIKEIEMQCNCPDYSTMCKHLAATFYGVGVRLDHEPELFFILRGVDKSELFAADLTKNITEKSSEDKIKTMKEVDISEVFGISLDTLDEPITPKIVKAKKETKNKKSKLKKPKPKAAKTKTAKAKKIKTKKPKKTLKKPKKITIKTKKAPAKPKKQTKG